MGRAAAKGEALLKSVEDILLKGVSMAKRRMLDRGQKTCSILLVVRLSCFFLVFL
jgi:hypothetical protein